MILVLPACAGVILISLLSSGNSSGITRMRGGDPALRDARYRAILYYPHARG